MFSAEQQAAVTTDAPRAVVVAGAGSGKTRVLVGRIAWLLEQGVLPERVLALTFTRAATEEMRQRVAVAVGATASEAILVSTFHGLAFQLLQRSPEWANRRPGFTLWGETEAKEAWVYAARDAGVRVGAKPRFEQLRANALVAKAYEAVQRRCNAVDYDVLEASLVSCVTRGHLYGLWDHVLVDEYQDTNAGQAAFVKALACDLLNPGGRLYVVGDPRQSIYRFRGAQPEEMLSLLRSPEWTRFDLGTNYRSCAPIVALSNSCAAAMPERWAASHAGTAETGAEPEFYLGVHDEAAHVARLAAECVGDGSDVAVLARTWAHLVTMQRALVARQVPCRMLRRAADPFTTEFGMAALAAFRLAVNPADDWSAEAVARVVGVDVDRARFKALSRRCSMHDVFMEHGEYAALWAEMTASVGDARATAEVVAGRMSALDGVGLVQLAMAAWSPRRSADAGLEDWSVSEFLGDLARGWTMPADEAEETWPGVVLSTVHGAKGLEWTVVFVVGASEGVWPNAASARSADELAEERRLFYVAVTRARERLVVTSPATRVPWPGAHAEACLPSRFALEVHHECH